MSIFPSRERCLSLEIYATVFLCFVAGECHWSVNIQSLILAEKKEITSQFNSSYRYIHDELSINNPDFENYLCQMYPDELVRREHYFFSY